MNVFWPQIKLSTQPSDRGVQELRTEPCLLKQWIHNIRVQWCAKVNFAA